MYAGKPFILFLCSSVLSKNVFPSTLFNVCTDKLGETLKMKENLYCGAEV